MITITDVDYRKQLPTLIVVILIIVFLPTSIKLLLSDRSAIGTNQKYRQAQLLRLSPQHPFEVMAKTPMKVKVTHLFPLPTVIVRWGNLPLLSPRSCLRCKSDSLSWISRCGSSNCPLFHCTLSLLLAYFWKWSVPGCRIDRIDPPPRCQYSHFFQAASASSPQSCERWTLSLKLDPRYRSLHPLAPFSSHFLADTSYRLSLPLFAEATLYFVVNIFDGSFVLKTSTPSLLPESATQSIVHVLPLIIRVVAGWSQSSPFRSFA